MGKSENTAVELIEFPVSSSEDLPVKLIVDTALKQANEAIASVIVSKRPDLALNYVKSAFASRHLNDIVAVQLCYETERRWKEFEIEGEFLEYIVPQVGKSVEVIRRYSKIGKMLNEVVPSKYRQTLWCRPIRNLIAIAQAVDEHGTFDDESWHRLARCVNGQEVRLCLDEILQKERKPTNRLVITMDNQGGLMAHRKNKSEPIGMLRLDETNPLVAEAIARIIASSGILER
jgi:hypothetical protein